MRDTFNRITLALVCLVTLALVASCQSQAPEPTGTPAIATQEVPSNPEPTSTPRPTEKVVATQTPVAPEPAAPAATPDEAEIRDSIVHALLALYTQSNRMDVETKLSDGKTTKSVIEFVPPDKKHILSVDEQIEYIVIGDMVYAKTNTSGKWEETQIPASVFLGDGEVTAEAIGRTVNDAKWVRDDILDGNAVIVYGYNSTTQSGDVELHSQTELWADENDGMVRKMIVDGEIMSAATDPSTGENKMQAVQALTTVLIDFDPTITIQAPSP